MYGVKIRKAAIFKFSLGRVNHDDGGSEDLFPWPQEDHG